MPRDLRTLVNAPIAWAQSRPSEPGAAGTAKAGWWWLLWACVITAAVLLVSLAASNHQRHEAGFDVFDEGAHYDYVLALTHGHVPASGARVSQTTLRMLSCVGAFASPPHGCGALYRNPEHYAADGYSYEAVEQPPLGYLPYLLTIQGQGYTESALVDARWGGFIWSVVGASVLVWIGWMLDLTLLELCAVLVICLLSPVQIHATATVTNDSAAVPAGAAVLATFLVSRRRHKAMVGIGLIVGLLVGFMKGFFVVAPFVVLAAVVLSDVAARRRPTRADFWQRYGCPLAMTAGAVAAYAAWLLLQDARAVVPTGVVLHALQGFSTTSYLRPSTIFTGIEDELSGLISSATPLYWLWNLAVYGSLAGVVLLRGTSRKPQLRAAASAIFVGVVALGIAFPLLNFIEGHYDFATPSRYALSLLPIVGVVVARTWRAQALLFVGVLLPGLAVIAQLVGGSP